MSHLSGINKKEIYTPLTTTETAPSPTALTTSHIAPALQAELLVGTASGAAASLTDSPADQKPLDHWLLQREASNASLRDDLVEGLEAYPEAKKLRDQLRSCTPSLEIAAWTEYGELHLKVDVAQRCGSRACPICIDVKRRKALGKLRPVLKEITDVYPGHAFLKYTLTIPHVAPEKAKDAIVRLRAAHTKFARRWAVAGTKHWMEVPVGRPSPGDQLMARPHIHGLALIANKNLGSAHAMEGKLSLLWAGALGVQERYFVDCGRLEGSNPTEVIKAVLSWANYAAKGAFKQGAMDIHPSAPAHENTTPICNFQADTPALLAFKEIVHRQRLTEPTGAFRKEYDLPKLHVPGDAISYKKFRWNSAVFAYQPT